MNKRILVYIMSVGLAFYGGMKLKQLQRLHTVKVGKLIVEFQDNSCGFKKPTIVKPVVKPTPKPNPPIIKVPPKTDVEKVLEPEKVKEKEPTLEVGSYDEIQKIDKCFEDLRKIDSKEKQWDHVKKFKECKIMELISENCAYIDEKEEQKKCAEEQKEPASVATRAYDAALDKEYGNKGFYGNIKEKVKEAIEETNDGYTE